jgi:hypothetical protein
MYTDRFVADIRPKTYGTIFSNIPKLCDGKAIRIYIPPILKTNQQITKTIDNYILIFSTSNIVLHQQTNRQFSLSNKNQ